MGRTVTNGTSFDPKGNNVETISTILRGDTRAVNVSAWSPKPIDGSLIPYAGFGKAAPDAPNGAQDFSTYNAETGSGPLLRMQWSNARRSDLGALDYKKVPVFMKDMLVKTRLYNYKIDEAITPGDAVFVSGNLLAIGTIAANGLWIPDIVRAADMSALTGWQIGTVVEGAALSALVNSGVTGTRGTQITLNLFQQPRWVELA